jgi:hypothetical protein
LPRINHFCLFPRSSGGIHPDRCQIVASHAADRDRHAAPA